MGSDAIPFWKRKSLSEMNAEEWESLCDGCARCCMLKLEDQDTGQINYTRVACQLLDTHSCRCGDYPNRSQRIPDCIHIHPDMTRRQFEWLPDSCAYRRLYENRELPEWHPLVSGDTGSVHRHGISMRGRCVSESYVPRSLLEDQIITFDDVD